MQFSIYRAKLDGTSQSKFAPTNFLGTSLTSIAIDWISRCIFWADNSSSTIGVVKLDGPIYYQRALLAGGSSPDVSMRVSNPVSLAVDPVNGLARYVTSV